MLKPFYLNKKDYENYYKNIKITKIYVMNNKNIACVAYF